MKSELQIELDIDLVEISSHKLALIYAISEHDASQID